MSFKNVRPLTRNTIFLLVIVTRIFEVKNQQYPPYNTVLYRELNSHTMVQAVFLMRNPGWMEMVDCFIIGSGHSAAELATKLPPQQIVFLNDVDMLRVLNDCGTLLLRKMDANEIYSSTNTNQLSTLSGDKESSLFTGLFIFPGTKWCGAGNIAKNKDDLGSEKETDMCCRDHDNCDDNINAGKEKHGLKNSALYTKSHCSCDTKFYDCLKKAGKKASNTIGDLYFNKLQVQCFKKSRPITSCKEKKGGILKACQVYEFDNSKPEIFQFFDAKQY